MTANRCSGDTFGRDESVEAAAGDTARATPPGSGTIVTLKFDSERLPGRPTLETALGI
jgi:hypothetical protein